MTATYLLPAPRTAPYGPGDRIMVATGDGRHLARVDEVVPVAGDRYTVFAQVMTPSSGSYLISTRVDASGRSDIVTPV